MLRSGVFHHFVTLLRGTIPRPWGEFMTSPAEYPDRIWFNPPRFWEATKGIQPEAAAELLDKIIDLAEARDLEELRNFDFVSFGTPR